MYHTHVSDLRQQSAGLYGAIVVLEEDGLRITAIKVAHAPVDPAVAYRFDYRGRSVVVSGDTIKSEALAGLARDADVLFHEALAAHIVRTMSEVATEVGRDRPARITMDILDYHATPVEAAETANDAGVRLLVYYHAVPYPFNAALESLFLRGVSDVRPDGVELRPPGRLETDRMVADLIALRQGQHVRVPDYDFATHQRRDPEPDAHPVALTLAPGVHVLLATVRALPNCGLGGWPGGQLHGDEPRPHPQPHAHPHPKFDLPDPNKRANAEGCLPCGCSRPAKACYSP